MASTTCTPLSLSSSLVAIDSKVSRLSATASPPQCVTFPTLPPLSVKSQRRAIRNSAYQKVSRNVVVMATGEGPASTETDTTELPEIVKTIQEKWDKVDDKYAVSSLAVAGVIALWGSTGLISAIDKLPLIPGVLELVGIGYTGWFVYKNLIYEPEREALIEKVKDTYKEVTGTS